MKTHTNNSCCIWEGLKCIFESLESIKEDKSVYSIVWGQIESIAKHKWFKMQIK